MLDRADELLRAERLENESKRPGAKGRDGGIDRGKPGDEDDFPEGRCRPKRPNQVDAGCIGELDVDDGDVESLARGRPNARLALRGAGDRNLELARSLEDVGEVGRQVEVVIDDVMFFFPWPPPAQPPSMTNSSSTQHATNQIPTTQHSRTPDKLPLFSPARTETV